MWTSSTPEASPSNRYDPLVRARNNVGDPPQRSPRSRTRCATLVLLILSSLVLAGCGRVGIPERPRTAYAPEFEGMWEHPRRGSPLVEDGYVREGTLAIEGSCVLIVEGGSQERLMLLLPRLLPLYRPPASDNRDIQAGGPEYAAAWLPTLHDEESQSLWVGSGERARAGDRVSVSGFSSGDHVEKCNADWSFRADHIEQWP